VKTAKERIGARKKAELKLIAELTFEATLSAEEKLSKLAGKAGRPGH
jgi:hypothetical protein